ncbi:LPD11 domain-containing protein [Paenibacillus sp. D51F]
MKTNENVRTMEYVGVDDWDRPVYKCIETGSLWKDIELGKCDMPVLYSCGNVFDGEPSSPIKSDLVVVFKTKYVENPHRFNYMMLNRLQSDCEYFLGYGNRNKNCLCGGSAKEHIEKMKELHNSFPEGEKPEWLTYEGILEYENRMSE